MTCLAVLAIVGYALTVIGVLSVGPVTSRALKKMDTDLRQEEQRKFAAFAHELAHPDQSPSHDEIEEDFRARLRAKHIPIASMNNANPTETVRFTIIRVGRANIPNTVIALVGGALSTLASVLSS